MTAQNALMEATNIDYKQVSPIEGELHVRIGADLIADRMETAYKQLQKDAEIKGFRKGKVPMKIVKQRYQTQVIRDTFERLVYESCRGAAVEKEIPLVGEPKVTKTNWLKWEEGNDMEYSATLELLPDPELKKYKGLSVTIEEHKVEDKDVNDMVQRMLESKAELLPVDTDRGVREDDLVVIDFVGSLDGEPLEDAKADNFLLDMGGEHTMPEFREGLVGMKAGEEKVIKVEYPSDYTNEKIAGQTVAYNVKVLELKRKQYPELNDELAKQFQAETALELKLNIRKSLEEQAEINRKNNTEEQVLMALLDANPLEVPGTLIQHQLNRILQEVGQAMQRQQFSPGLIEEYMKKNIDGLTARAAREVKLALLLPKVVEAEKISATDEEVDERLQMIATSAGKDLKEVKQHFKSPDRAEELKNQIARDKAIDLMASTAKVKTEKPKKDK